MTAHQLPAFATILAIGSLLCGCNSGGDTELVGLSVSGLSETRTFAACVEQVLNVASDTADSQSVYSWNISAPTNASFSFEPNADELHFVARTTGEYTISVTECHSNTSSDSDCSVTEFSVTVVMGTDTNNNGIGDACEASDCVPSCEGRHCGNDPICGQSCGTCGDNETCNANGQCEAACVPACEGRTCGLDPVCHQSCGTCGDGQTCNEEKGICVAQCVPACAGQVCGLDPVCQTSCGTCAEGSACTAQGSCEAVPEQGRVVTIVMALTDKRLSFTDPHFKQRAQLVERTVQWVSPVEAPKVLVVLDDSCADWSKEANWIRSTLVKHGMVADFLLEPARGLSADNLEGYDVVWFTNPALPVDDDKTIVTLTRFAKSGGGLVLQGDDITQPSAMQPLTRLHYTNNGKYVCGRFFDDNRGSSYTVRVTRGEHPITTSIAGNTYYYGDDIDSSTLIADANATVLAWAQVGSCNHGKSSHANCGKQPVIVAYDMNE